MKTVLVGINSKYIHTCLAIWYLKASIKYVTDVVSREFTINESRDAILSELFKEKPDILAFSCYIWNIELVHVLAAEIKKLLPECIIILGGPEVSYNAAEVLGKNSALDFILCGEGEEVFPILHKSIVSRSEGHKELRGIAYREGNTIVFNEGFNLVGELDGIETPYTQELLDSAAQRILYYESSRGCPFSCSYCISSTFKGVRFFSMERVKRDLDTLLMYKPRLIKFVDRTFNCSRERAKEIFSHIISLDCDTVFHFEAAADLFDDELTEMLSQAPKGRIQLEIGIQTTNAESLSEVDRVTDIEKLRNNVTVILAAGNIHVHLDLIAGLPYERLDSFINSFDQVYGMRPHQLQLGFLKLLNGSKIRKEAEKHGYVFRDYPPYEVLGNNYISFDDILLLKDVEEVLERYFNSNRFTESIRFLEEYLFSGAFEFYRELSAFCRENGYLDRPVSYRENILILFDFIKQVLSEKAYCSENSCGSWQGIPSGAGPLERFRQTMVFDFLSSDSSCTVPECLKNTEDIVPAGTVHGLLRNEAFIAAYLPGFGGVQAKNILKKVFFVNLNVYTGDGMLILFDYSRKEPVNEKYRAAFIDRDLLKKLL